MPSTVEFLTARPVPVTGVRFTDVGIETERDDFTEEEVGAIIDYSLRLVSAVDKTVSVSSWVLGDSLTLESRTWGNRHTGSKYDLVAASLGRSPRVIKNIVRTCRHIPVHRRRPELTFSHHVTVAAHTLEVAEQDRLLTEAVENKYSVYQLRCACNGVSTADRNCRLSKFVEYCRMKKLQADKFRSAANDMDYTDAVELLSAMEPMIKLYHAVEARVLFLMNASDGSQDARLEEAMRRAERRPS